MTNPDFLNPPIEVVATSPRLQMIVSRLKSAGLRPYESRNEPNNEDPILIDAASMNGTQIHQLKRQMVHQSDRIRVVLASPDAPTLPDAIILTHESELSSIPARLEVIRRKLDRLTEVRLRAKTAEDITGSQIKCYSDAPASILYLGDGSSRFLAISGGLKSLDVSVTAALTALTARDYLSERKFSCILVDIDEGAANALRFLRDFAGDHFASCVPVFAMIRSGTNRSLDQQAALANATEVIDADLPIMEIADTISMLAEYHKAATPLTPDLATDPRIKDRMTGLFTSAYLKQHLQNQIDSTEGQLMPLSFLTLQLASSHDGNTAARKALPALAKHVLADMRQTDCAGRMNWSTIGISLRNTPYAGGVKLAKRLVDQLGGSELSALGTPLGSSGSLSWRVTEKRRYHSADDLFKTGIKGPQTRIIQAA